jgi:hypothetical protein
MVIEIETIETSSLGDRSYLATDGQVAVVIDPQRDIDRVLDLVERRGVRVTHVLETPTCTTTTSAGAWNWPALPVRHTWCPPAVVSSSNTCRRAMARY